jgi:EAL domain-containing protein (putative c-di-GMP-specific phosphodiesterase class I)
MARNLRMKLVAEGVETPGQLRFLESQQCEYMQGFMLSRPLESQAYADAFLKAESSLSNGLVVCRSILGVANAGTT